MSLFSDINFNSLSNLVYTSLSDFKFTLLSKLDPILSVRLNKLEPILLLNSTNALYTDTESRKKEIITRPYIKASALVGPGVGKGENWVGPDKKMETDVVSTAKKSGGLTIRLDKIARADSKPGAKLDNKKEADFDYSANSKEGQILDQT